MIHRLTIENFRSFNEKVELDFTVDPKKAGRPGYIETKTGETVSRLNMLIGPNASGKSNVLKALAVLHWAIVQSAEQNAQKIEYLFQFYGNNGPVRIGIECSDVTGDIYRYEIALLPKPLRFVEERLSKRATKRSQWETIFDREIGEDGTTITFRKTTPDWAGITQRPNASLIGSRVLAGSKPGVASPEWELARKIQAFVVNSFGNVSSEYHDEPAGLWWEDIGQKLSKDKKLLQQASTFMQNADVGIAGLELQKFEMSDPKEGQVEIILPKFKHSIGNPPKVVPLEFNLESVGTRILLSLFADAYPVAAESGIISLDEIERGIHPHILPELVSALTPPGTASQVFLVSHCDYLLRYLEHDQVFLTEKQDDGATTIYRADTVEGFKTDRNLLNWYHAGKLGAIPRL